MPSSARRSANFAALEQKPCPCSTCIFVYPLSGRILRTLTSSLASAADMLLGPSLKLGTPWLEDARATDAFNLGFLAAYRVMKSRCMVHSPKRATLFYVPLLRRGKSSQAACANERDHLERMRALFKTSDGVAYMDRNAGADHVTVSSRTVGASTRARLPSTARVDWVAQHGLWWMAGQELLGLAL